MKSRPILFSAPMVRTLLDGSKTQTRRVMKPQPPEDCGEIEFGPYHPAVTRSGEDEPGPEVFGVYSLDGAWGLKCPFGRPGDELWVKETFRQWPDGICYRADGRDSDIADSVHSPWKPSIFMPRSASRITLQITGVRVERLQSISRGDAMVEGCPFPNMAQRPDPRDWYADLWHSINGPGSWALNPWVFVVSFRRI